MPIKITVDDIRKAGFCVPGLREGAERLGLDIRRVVKADYTVEEVEHIEDANVQRAIMEAKRRVGESE